MSKKLVVEVRLIIEAERLRKISDRAIARYLAADLAMQLRKTSKQR